MSRVARNILFKRNFSLLFLAFFLLFTACSNGGDIVSTPVPFNPPEKTIEEDAPLSDFGTIIEVNHTDELSQAFEQATNLLSQATKENPVIVTVVLNDGVYHLQDSISINSGFENGQLNIIAKEGTNPVISGLAELNPSDFKKVEGKEYYMYQFAPDNQGNFPVFRDLYVNQNKALISKSKSYKTFEHFIGTNAAEQKGIYIHPDLAAMIDNQDIAGCEFYLSADWEYYIVHVDSVDSSDTKSFNDTDYVMLRIDPEQLQEWMTRHNRVLNMNNRDYYLMNHPNFIDAGGEFAYDSNTGRLWFRPNDNTNIQDIKFEISTVETLFNFNNAKNVLIDGISFTGTTCTQIPEKGYLSAQANGESRVAGPLHIAALYFKNGENISVRNCKFNNLGNNGIMFRNKTINASITGCDFKNIAMSAITIGEHGWTWSDTNSATNIKIYNNYLEHIGYEYPSAVALYISLVKDAKILNNTIIDTAYTGISIGWGWAYAQFKYGESYCVNNVEVAYNRIENYMQVTRDGGAIYILGSSAEETYRENFNYLHDNYAYIENADDKQIAFYFDEASSNWHAYDNVSIGALRSLFIQHEAGTFARNILAERLYADEYISPKNANEERHVIVKNIRIAKTEDVYTKYPEARMIEYMSGCVRDSK